MRVDFKTLEAEFNRVLLSLNFTPEKAQACANIFASNSCDGVYSHGLNRFPVFVENIKEGLIMPDAEPELEAELGIVKRYNGNLGPGILNATFCMGKAIEEAKDSGIGCIALRNTNHWMRGGTYGWQAADKGFIGICFTNTIANVPPWGGVDARLGNNPLVIAVPRKQGNVVLDMAMSQFSYGKMQEYQFKNQELPFDGGFDNKNQLTKNPEQIISSQRALPIGFWKGSGLSLMLDLLATVLSNGKSTADISTSGKKETGVSQVFIAINPGNYSHSEELIENILAYTKSTKPINEHEPITYPGENTLRKRKENLEKGILVDEAIWQQVKNL